MQRDRSLSQNSTLKHNLNKKSQISPLSTQKQPLNIIPQERNNSKQTQNTKNNSILKQHQVQQKLSINKHLLLQQPVLSQQSDRSLHSRNLSTDHSAAKKQKQKHSPTKVMVLKPSDNGMLAELVKASASFLADHYSPEKKKRQYKINEKQRQSRSPVKKQESQLPLNQQEIPSQYMNIHKQAESKENIEFSIAKEIQLMKKMKNFEKQQKSKRQTNIQQKDFSINQQPQISNRDKSKGNVQSRNNSSSNNYYNSKSVKQTSQALIDRLTRSSSHMKNINPQNVSQRLVSKVLNKSCNNNHNNNDTLYEQTVTTDSYHDKSQFNISQLLKSTIDYNNNSNSTILDQQLIPSRLLDQSSYQQQQDSLNNSNNLEQQQQQNSSQNILNSKTTASKFIERALEREKQKQNQVQQSFLSCLEDQSFDIKSIPNNNNENFFNQTIKPATLNNLKNTNNIQKVNKEDSYIIRAKDEYDEYLQLERSQSKSRLDNLPIQSKTYQVLSKRQQQLQQANLSNSQNDLELTSNSLQDIKKQIENVNEQQSLDQVKNQKIQELAIINEKLKQMKDKIKKEQIKDKVVMKMNSSSYLDQELNKMNKTFDIKANKHKQQKLIQSILGDTIEEDIQNNKNVIQKQNTTSYRQNNKSTLQSNRQVIKDKQESKSLNRTQSQIQQQQRPRTQSKVGISRQNNNQIVNSQSNNKSQINNKNTLTNHSTISYKDEKQKQSKSTASSQVRQSQHSSKSRLQQKKQSNQSFTQQELQLISQTIDYTTSILDINACNLENQITLDNSILSNKSQNNHILNQSQKQERQSIHISKNEQIMRNSINENQEVNEQTLKHQLKIVTDKMLKYMKEINFTTIIDFKRQDDNPSKSCFRAARCLCLLISSFYDDQKSKKQREEKSNNICEFTQWSQIKNYINLNSQKIVYNISTIQQKCDNQLYNLQTIKNIYKEIFMMMDEQVESQSPRIRNLQYKPVFCFVFFTINYILITEKIQHFKKKQAALNAISNFNTLSNDSQSQQNNVFKVNNKQDKKKQQQTQSSNRQSLNESQSKNSTSSIMSFANSRQPSIKNIPPCVSQQKQQNQQIQSNSQQQNRSISKVTLRQKQLQKTSHEYYQGPQSNLKTQQQQYTDESPSSYVPVTVSACTEFQNFKYKSTQLSHIKPKVVHNTDNETIIITPIDLKIKPHQQQNDDISPFKIEITQNLYKQLNEEDNDQIIDNQIYYDNEQAQNNIQNNKQNLESKLSFGYEDDDGQRSSSVIRVRSQKSYSPRSSTQIAQQFSANKDNDANFENRVLQMTNITQQLQISHQQQQDNSIKSLQSSSLQENDDQSFTLKLNEIIITNNIKIQDDTKNDNTIHDQQQDIIVQDQQVEQILNNNDYLEEEQQQDQQIIDKPLQSQSRNSICSHQNNNNDEIQQQNDLSFQIEQQQEEQMLSLQQQESIKVNHEQTNYLNQLKNKHYSHRNEKISTLQDQQNDYYELNQSDLELQSEMQSVSDSLYSSNLNRNYNNTLDNIFNIKLQQLQKIHDDEDNNKNDDNDTEQKQQQQSHHHPIMPYLDLKKQQSCIKEQNRLFDYELNQDSNQIFNRQQTQNFHQSQQQQQLEVDSQSFKINLHSLQLLNDSFNNNNQLDSAKTEIIQNQQNIQLSQDKMIRKSKQNSPIQDSINQTTISQKLQDIKNINESQQKQQQIKKINNSKYYQQQLDQLINNQNSITLSSQNDYKYAKIDENQKQQMKAMLENRRKSQERRKGGQLEKQTWDIINQLSKSFNEK